VNVGFMPLPHQRGLAEGTGSFDVEWVSFAVVDNGTLFFYSLEIKNIPDYFYLRAQEFEVSHLPLLEGSLHNPHPVIHCLKGALLRRLTGFDCDVGLF
jgi:hypothetical protein